MLDGEWHMGYADDAVAAQLPEIRCLERLRELPHQFADAVVPGCFQEELMRHGVEPDCYTGNNIKRMEAYEGTHVYYGRTFCCEIPEKTEAYLLFDCLDTVAEVYINGALAARCENQFTQQKIAVGQWLRSGENEVVVHILPVCLEARRYTIPAGSNALEYSYESLVIRKSACSFGWDIMPRLVTCGIPRSVRLVFEPEFRITDWHFMVCEVDAAQRTADGYLHYSVSIGREPCRDYRVRMEARCGEHVFSAEKPLWFTTGRIRFHADGAKLWWPWEMGEPNLYEVEIQLIRDGRCVDRVCFHTGMRVVELSRTDLTTVQGDGDFTIWVNHKRFFAKGTNWVPVDALPSRRAERLSAALTLIKEAGCNTVRCWGGGYYEDSDFFDACDTMGLLVWQDFAMACGAYPQDERMCRLVYDEAVSIIRRLRHHPSLCIWAGDNEGDFTYYVGGPKRDGAENRLTREVIPRALFEYDTTRPYIPSSPYISTQALAQRRIEDIAEDHIWGPRDYFRGAFYRQTKCHFASEIGYHGCPSPQSLKRFLSPEHWFPPQGDEQWILHGASPDTEDGPFVYRVDLMIRQVETLFGEVPENMRDFALASQISQAEAKKYFIERFRAGKWRTTGIIWWNILDAWPQISDAVVDYYFCRKLAYWYIAAAQQTVCLMMDEREDGKLVLVGCNDGPGSCPVTYRICADGEREPLWQGKADIPGFGKAELAVAEEAVPDNRLYILEWDTPQGQGLNHYLHLKPPISLQWYCDRMRHYGLLRLEGFEEEVTE